MTKQTSVAMAIAALIGVNALWGMSFPIMKALNETIASVVTPGQEFSIWPISRQVASSSLMIGTRFALATLLLGIFLPRLIRHATHEEWLAGFWIGVVFCIGLIMQVIGLASIPASRSGFLTSLTAVYTPILSSLIFRKPPSWSVWVGIGLALAGVLVLSGVVPLRSSQAVESSLLEVPLNWGDLWTTLGSLFFSVQVLLVDYYGRKHRSAYFTPSMFLTTICISVLAFGVSAFAFDHVVVGASPPNGWGMLFREPSFGAMVLFLAFFCSLLSFLGMNTYQPYVSASQASVIYSTEPLFASVWAMFLPGLIGAWISLQYTNEKLTLELIMGGILVSIANVIALWPQKPSTLSSPLISSAEAD